MGKRTALCSVISVHTERCIVVGGVGFIDAHTGRGEVG